MKAHALDHIANLIERYLLPSSGVSREELVSEIIGVIEIKTGRRFTGGRRTGLEKE